MIYIHYLKKKEIIVGNALVELLENWEDIVELKYGNKLKGKSSYLSFKRKNYNFPQKKLGIQ